MKKQKWPIPPLLFITGLYCLKIAVTVTVIETDLLVKFTSNHYCWTLYFVVKRRNEKKKIPSIQRIYYFECSGSLV
jgi:hypothetical protein